MNHRFFAQAFIQAINEVTRPDYATELNRKTHDVDYGNIGQKGYEVASRFVLSDTARNVTTHLYFINGAGSDDMKPDTDYYMEQTQKKDKEASNPVNGQP